MSKCSDKFKRWCFLSKILYLGFPIAGANGFKYQASKGGRGEGGVQGLFPLFLVFLIEDNDSHQELFSE